AEVGEPGLDLAPLAGEPLDELEVARVVRVGELVAQDQLAVAVPVRVPVVERIARGVRPPVLHRLQHPGHVDADVVIGPVPVDDPCDPAHGSSYGSTSRYSS